MDIKSFPLVIQLLLGSSLFFSCIERTTTIKKPIVVWMLRSPYSTDPIDYDAFSHHLAFRSVMSSVVSQYRVGEYVGVLAESWRVDSDHKTWRFKIRSNLLFENGDPITPQIIMSSWMRMAFLLKNRNSKSGFLDELEGYENIQSIDSKISGLQIEQPNSLVLKFKKPFIKLLDTISFGLYGVVHPNLYDPKTGIWKDPKAFISSGAYKIMSWDKDSIQLNLREDFLPEMRHKNPLKEVHIVWDASKKLDADLKTGDSIEESLVLNHEFYGVAVSSIAYIHCLSWSHSKSPCYDFQKRRFLRDLFYNEFEKSGFKPVRSFFPLTIKGVKEVSKDINSTKQNILANLSAVKFKSNHSSHILSVCYNKTINELINRVGLKASFVDIPHQEINTQSTPNLPNYKVDIMPQKTGILIDDPDADIRFMFLSKEGIRLPDTDGRIHEELKKDPLDIQRINELLWEQAVIWPITHFASGFWAKKNMFDFSMVNLVLPPTEFQWIGWKK